jgi:16S rRNA (guanine966-N2)-methyltransferase
MQATPRPGLLYGHAREGEGKRRSPEIRNPKAEIAKPSGIGSALNGEATDPSLSRSDCTECGTGCGLRVSDLGFPSDFGASDFGFQPSLRRPAPRTPFQAWPVPATVYSGAKMRITGGKAARRRLKVPKGLAVRPTPDLVKQAVFNSLGGRVAGARVLELFAGTGALSLECLSRGAASALCVEKSHRHAEVLRQNLAAAGFSPEVLQVRVQDVFSALAQLAAAGQRFDLVMADPPYGQKNIGRRSESAAQRLLDDPRLGRLLAPGGLLVLGHAKRDTLSPPDHWREVKLLRHGDSIMRFFNRQEAAITFETPTASLIPAQGNALGLSAKDHSER